MIKINIIFLILQCIINADNLIIRIISFSHAKIDFTKEDLAILDNTVDVFKKTKDIGFLENKKEGWINKLTKDLETLQIKLHDDLDKASELRLESDTMGDINVPASRYWGAQTQRSLHHFSIGNDLMPIEVSHALALVKKCAAIVNSTHKKNDDNKDLLSKDKANRIIKAADEILSGTLDDNFPLYVWQTGSGTQSNMNVNEVIANRANEISKIQVTVETKIHPNDDVNMSQSSNDVFPTAMHIAAAIEIAGSPSISLRPSRNYPINNDSHNHNKNRIPLLQSIDKLRKSLNQKAKDYNDIVKVGRTHLQDALPLTFGQEISGWIAQLDICYKYIEQALDGVYDLAIGGTAVGTGFDSFSIFGERNGFTNFKGNKVTLPFSTQ